MNLRTPSERMFRTRLADAAKQPPNFAGRYRFTTWGCGSPCRAGAIVDLATGDVFSPPLAKGTGWSHFLLCRGESESARVECRVNSRLLILQCGSDWPERWKLNPPDTYYFVWDDNRFRQLLHLPQPAPAEPRTK